MKSDEKWPSCAYFCKLRSSILPIFDNLFGKNDKILEHCYFNSFYSKYNTDSHLLWKFELKRMKNNDFTAFFRPKYYSESDQKI